MTVLLPGNAVPPSLKVIVPVAVLGSTVAVKDTNWPMVDGLGGNDVKDVLVEAVVTVCVQVFDVIGR